MMKLIQSSVFRYLLTGGLAFFADYLTLIGLYYGIGLSLAVSTSIGFFFGFIISFIVNRYWVYAERGRSGSGLIQLIEYSLLVAFNYLFTVVSVGLLYSHGLQPFVSKILVMAAIIVWNYIIFSRIIFRAR